MAKYVALGRFRVGMDFTDAKERVEKVKAALASVKAKLEILYYTMGPCDFVTVIDAPDAESAAADPARSADRAPPWCMLVTMAASRRSRPLARWAHWLVLGCYLLALGVAPLLHHDLECHVKSATHCTACMASPPGLCSAAGAPSDAARLHDAGSVEAARAVAPVPAFAVEAPGRSPPA